MGHGWEQERSVLRLGLRLGLGLGLGVRVSVRTSSPALDPVLVTCTVYVMLVAGEPTRRVCPFGGLATRRVCPFGGGAGDHESVKEV